MSFDMKNHNEHFGVTEDRKKPGGSNAGKHDKGPYCGPSGGAPKGTYPVDTIKRAKAALAYARHAPNPSGIKACVYRHWPTLKKTSKGASEEGHSMAKEVPVDSLFFMEAENAVSLSEAKEGEGQGKAEMTVYSGKPMKHWYWGDVSIDVSGMKFASKTLPVLEDHETDRKIGFESKPSIIEGMVVFPSIQLLNTTYANQFKENSKAGFPYQASIRAVPLGIEDVPEGKSAESNGYSLKGPAKIIRSSLIKEGSVCTFGVDSSTRSLALHDKNLGDVTLTFTSIGGNDKEEENMENLTFDEVKEKFSEELKEMVGEAVGTAVSEKDKKIEELEAVNKTLSDNGKESTDRLAKLEKDLAILTEKGLKATANAIFEKKLSESDIPERLHSKVRKQLDYGSFVEDGKLDEVKWAASVEEEIKDWGEFKEADVQGSGIMSKSAEGSEEDLEASKAEDKVVDRLLGYIPQPTKENTKTQ